MRSLKFTYGVDQTGHGFYWPRSTVKRSEWLETKRLRPVEAQSVYQCNPGARLGDIFLESDFAWYEPPPLLELGIQSPVVANFCARGAMVIQGWDTALSAQSSADWSVGVTGLLIPCEDYHRGEDIETYGECDAHYDIYILDVFRAKLDFGDAVAAVRTQYMKWSPQMVIVEKRASGTPILQALANSGIPFEGVEPLESKRERVINTRGVGSVQGWFRLHRVHFPIYADWLDALVREIKDFTGEKGKVDDQVDALAHMLGYAIREGGMTIRMPSDYMNPAKLAEMLRPKDAFDPLAQLFRVPDIEIPTLRDAGLINDPFSDRCGRCANFREAETLCNFHRIRTTAVSPACEMFDPSDGLLFVNWR